MGNESPPSIPRALPALTGLRGIAALWVVGFHIVYIGHRTLPQIVLADVPFLSVGWAGVDLFFVLSGFILMHSHKEDFRNVTIEILLSFAKRRFWRVYPLSAFVLLLIGALYLLDKSFVQSLPKPLDSVGFIKTATLTTGWRLPLDGASWNEPVWSLSVELLGYMTFPALASFAVRTKSGPLAIALVVGCLLAWPCWLFSTTGTFDNSIGGVRAILRMQSGFTAGVALYVVRSTYQEISTKAADLLAGSAAASTLLLALLPNGVAVMPVTFAVLIFSLAYPGSFIEQLFSSRLVMAAGRISFPVYLLHAVPLFSLNHHLAEAGVDSLFTYLAAITCYMILMIAVAWLLHRYIEVAFAKGPQWRSAQRLAAT